MFLKKIFNVKFPRQIFAVFSISVLIALAAFGQTPQTSELPPAQIIEREMKGAETHRYKFDLRAGEFFQVRVEQKSADVALKIVGANGKTLTAMDSPNGREGFEILSFVAAMSGDFILEVGSFDAKAEKGVYTIRRETPRTATAQDKKRVEIERTFIEAIAARDAENQTEIALTKLNEAAKGWRELKDDYLLALTAQNIGFLKTKQADILSKADKKQEALALYIEAAASFNEGGDKAQRADALGKISGIYQSLNEKEKAIASLSEAISIYKETNKSLEMINRSTLAFLHASLGQSKKALEVAEPALRYFRAAPEGLTEAQRKFWESSLLQTIIIAYQQAGEIEKSIETSNQLVVIYRELGAKSGEIIYTSSIGTNYNTLGNHAESKRFFESALVLLAAAKAEDFAAYEKFNPNARKSIELTAVSGLAQAVSNSGEKQKALEYYQKALQISDEIGDKVTKQSVLLGIAGIYESFYEWEKAFDAATQSLALAEQVGDKRSVAFMLNYVGKVYSNRNENRKALELFQRALKTIREAKASTTEQSEIARVKRTEANILNNTGLIYSDLGENEKALDFYNQSLKIRRETDDNDEEATTLSNIASVYSMRGEKQKALEYLKLTRETFAKASPQIKASSRAARIEANALHDIGVIKRELGDLREAANYFNQSLAIARSKKFKDVEARTLNSLGNVENNLGELKKSLELYRASLALHKATGNKEGEIVALINIGNAIADLGESTEALAYFEQALSLAKAIESKEKIAVVLNKLGKIYTNQSEYKKALDYYNQALKISREIEDKASLTVALADIGLIYAQMSEREKALDFNRQALLIIRQSGDKSNEAAMLGNIGKIYFELGENAKASDFHRQSLKLAEMVGDKVTQTSAFVSIGGVQSEAGEKQKAAASFESALTLSRETGYKSAEIVALRNLGIIRAEQGDAQKGLQLLNESLNLARKHADRFTEGRNQAALGKIYAETGEAEKAVELVYQSFLIAREIGDKDGEAAALKRLMSVWTILQNKQLAIFFGKQAVNKYQELRGSIRNLERETQDIFRDKVTDAYRDLADLLIGEGRFAEAQQVLTMLKEEETSEFVRRDAQEIAALAQRANLKPSERAALEKYDALAGNIAKLGAEFALLQLKKPADENTPFPERARYEEIEAQIKTANAAFRIFLQELAKEIGAQAKEQINFDRSLQGDLKQIGAGTVALATIVGAERYRVVLTTPTIQLDAKTEIKAADLNKKIFAFREALQNPNVDPRPLGKELYDILIKPIEKDLLAANAKTLLWSLDGALRYVPLAALWDGEQYLAQKYRNVLITSTARKNLLVPVKTDWRVLGAGVTRQSTIKVEDETITFSSLPGVANELKAIVQNESGGAADLGLLAGRRFLDADFTVDALEDSLSKSDAKARYNVVHLATHFRLGADTASSFLLLGGDKSLTLEQVADSAEMDFSDVELVTLSACNTAFGGEANGKEVDSLATFIEMRGAKAVMATLWAVADESTQILMSEFYRLHKANPQITKAEAMQAAQKAMIEGRLKSSGKQTGCRSEVVKFGGAKQIEFKCNANAPFAHPYFWSPFVLIGNWR